MNESAGPLQNLPKHWIKYLTAKYGQRYGIDTGGEKSPVAKLPELSVPVIKKALKDLEVLAIIGRKDGQPLFMISKHDSKTTRFRIFSTTADGGNYGSKGMSYGYGRRGRHTADYYDANEVMSIIQDMVKDPSLSNVTIETIGKDKEREAKYKSRYQQRTGVLDPLDAPEDNWGQKATSPAQENRGKKYSSIKKAKLDTRVDYERNKLKTQIIAALDAALDTAIKDMKEGYTFQLSADTLGKTIMKKVDLSSIKNLAEKYSAIKGNYDRNPYEMYKKLKRTK